MRRKVLIVSTITFLIVVLISFLVRQLSQEFIFAHSLSCQSEACQNKQVVLAKLDLAQHQNKTISGLYAGDERMFKPHWWEGAPPGDDIFEQFVDHVQDSTGERVGIVEVRFTSYEAEHKHGDLDEIVELLDQRVWQQGSIPAISDFTLNPWNGEDGRNREIGQFEDLFNPATLTYARLHTEFEFIAEGLHRLQEKGIPVLFRPFHENTGGWFWWGRRTLSPEEYQRLWRYTFNYFESTQGLENLIWVYGPSTSHYELIPETYPGDDYVHVVGVSNYSCSPGRSDVVESYATLKAIAPDKPFAFTELGPERDGRCQDSYNENLVQALENAVPEVVYFLNWFGPRAALALYPNADKVLQHSDIWNADDLQQIERSLED